MPLMLLKKQIINKYLIIFKIFIKRKKFQKIKLIVGSGGVTYRDWIETDIRTLDITSISSWKQLFKPNEITNILAEHVWEHLTPEESREALNNCYKFMKTNGRLRIAVPDGYFPDNDYIDYVKPGGHGLGSEDHKILYTYKTLQKELEEVGFVVELVEYFDENGCFFKNEWSVEEGFIQRSLEHDGRNVNEVKYTSLIIDGIKKEINYCARK